MNKKWVVNCRKEKYDIYIGRPSKYGNQWSHLPNTLAKYKVSSREEAIQKHKEMVLSDPKLIEMIKKELKGEILGCFCSPLPCHGDIYAEIANSENDHR